MASGRKQVEKVDSNQKDVKARIVSAALDIFAMKGFEATTIREITDAAEANVAAVNYYFGSKFELIRAVVVEALGPLNATRAAALDKLEAESGGVPTVPDLLEALLAPLVFSPRGADDGRVTIRLLLQMRAGAGPLASQLLSEQFDTVAKRYIAALEAAAPEFSHQEIVLRYEFARGAAMQVLGDIDPRSARLSRLDAGATNNDAALLAELVRFAAGGFGVVLGSADWAPRSLPQQDKAQETEA